MPEKRLFFPITKIDEERRLIYGCASSEEVDNANEIFDYEGSKPYIQAWSDSYLKKTTDAGQEPSAGNLRSMHKAVSAGKLENVIFDDAGKKVDVIAKVTDDAEWYKCLTGTYTGFSFGGKPVGKKWIDTAKAAMRYIINPNELSLADSPCVPSAIFYEVLKCDGTTETRQHKAATRGGETLKNINILKVEAAGEIQKGMYSVGRLADLLSSLQYLQSDTAYEAQYEGDESPLPAQLKQLATDMAACLVNMVSEETLELIETMKVDPAGEIQKAGNRNNKKDQDKIQAVHDHARDLGAKCSGVEKIENGGENTIMKLDGEALTQVSEMIAKITGAQAETIQKLEIQATADKETIQKLQVQIDTINKIELPAKATANAAAAAAVSKELDANPDLINKTDINTAANNVFNKITANQDFGCY